MWSVALLVYFILILFFILFYFILVHFYNTHQVLVGLPQGVGGLAIYFIPFILLLLHAPRACRAFPRDYAGLAILFDSF
jgi:hypothetical protein